MKWSNTTGHQINKESDTHKFDNRKMGVFDFHITTTARNHELKSHSWHYLFKDYQGSLDVITDEIGSVIDDVAFDAWGERRKANNGHAITDSEKRAFNNKTYGNHLATANMRITTRGYTNHEMLDGVGLIHMNGRLYDAKLARFISADPLIPDPMNTQSYNRYSYVRNQPTYYTDPSGYQEKQPEEVLVTGTRKGDDDTSNDGSVTIEGDAYDDLIASLDAFGGLDYSEDFDDGSAIGVYSDANGQKYAILRDKSGKIVNARVASFQAFLKVNAKNPSVGIVEFLSATGGLVYPVIGPKGVSIGQRGGEAAIQHSTNIREGGFLSKTRHVLGFFKSPEFFGALSRAGSIIGGGAQVFAGGAICYGSAGLACAGGAGLIVLGADNITEGVSNNSVQPLRSALSTVIEDKQTVDFVHAGINVVSSAAAAFRQVRRTDLIGIGESSTETAITRASKLEIGIELGTTTTTIAGPLTND